MTEKKPRTRRPLTLGAALDKLITIRTDHVLALATARERIAKDIGDRRAAVFELLPEEHREAVRRALDAADQAAGDEASEALDDIGGFGVDPKDSERLLELRQIIDDEIGWPTFEAEERADYSARLRDLHRQRLAIAKALADSKAGNVEGDQVLAELLDEIAREVNDPHPLPVSADGAREAKATPDAIPDLEPDSEPPPGATVIGFDAEGNPSLGGPPLPKGAQPYVESDVARAARRGAR